MIAAAASHAPAAAQISREAAQRVQVLIDSCQEPAEDIAAAVQACTDLLGLEFPSDPKFRNAMTISRGMQYLRLGDRARARADFEASLESGPNGGGLYGRGLVRIAEGEMRRGWADIDRASKIAPQIPARYEMFGLKPPPRD